MLRFAHSPMPLPCMGRYRCVCCSHGGRHRATWHPRQPQHLPQLSMRVCGGSRRSWFCCCQLIVRWQQEELNAAVAHGPRHLAMPAHAKPGMWEGSVHFWQPRCRRAEWGTSGCCAQAGCPCRPMRSPGVQCQEEAEAGVRRHDARAGTAAAATLVQQQHACTGGGGASISVT